MLHPQMGAQRIDPAVGGRAVGTHGPLGGVGVKVVPAIGHLLAAGAAPPHGARIAGRREHVVVRHGVMRIMASCSSCSAGSSAGSHSARNRSSSSGTIRRISRSLIAITKRRWAVVTVAGGHIVQRMVLAFQGRRQVHPERGRRGRGRRRGRQGGRQVVAGAAACGSRTRKRRTEHTTARRAGRKSAQRNRFL